MPLFRAELRLAAERQGTPWRKWRNTFYIVEADAAGAADQCRNAWEVVLRNHCRAFVYAYEVYATDLVPNTSNYVLMPVDTEFQRGNLDAGSDFYALEHCLAISIAVPNSRPSRKFWRPGLLESDFVDGVFQNTTLRDQIIEDWNTMIGNNANYDVDGEPWTSVLSVKQSIRRLGRTAPFSVPAGPGA